MPRIILGATAVDGTLPPDHLSQPELHELHELLHQYRQHTDAAQVIHDRINLLLMTARDRRGLAGRIQVEPSDGRIEQIPEDPNHGGTDGR